MPVSTDQYTEVSKRMLSLYEDSERRLISIIKNNLAKGIDASDWAVRKLSDVQSVRKQLEKAVAEFSKERGELTHEVINQAYDGGKQAFINDTEQFLIASGINGVDPNAGKAADIFADLDNRMNAADRQILRNANDAYAEIVGASASMVANGTITYRQAVADELDEFARNGITSFVDKSGRSWDMSTYAEMATLTAIERATRNGYIDTMKAYGFDLAIISSHAGCCPLCEAWQDVIISVSGSNKDYPSLADAENGGCFHPRCLHHIDAYYEGYSRQGKNYPEDVKEPNYGYSERQKQRQYERLIRMQKRRMAASTDPKTERIAYSKVRQYQAKIRELIYDYNKAVPKSEDMLLRENWREGGRQVLSPEAKNIPPVR